MIVFDLACGSSGHVFEAWFSSSDDYEKQRKRKLIGCPVCGDSSVSKSIMAPHVAAKGNQISVSKKSNAVMTDAANPQMSEMKQLIGRIAELQAETIKDSTWVGEDFERQARAMTKGDMDTALIHGKATPEQARDMIEDGVGVVPLLIPVVPPEDRN
jgi:hypothetical protein